VQGRQKLFVGQVLALAHLDQQYRPLAPFRVGAPDDGGKRDLRQRADDRLDLRRIDPFAAGLDEILGAAGDDEVALAVDAARSPVSNHPSASVAGSSCPR